MANYPSNMTDSEWNHYFRFWTKLVYWEQVHPTIQDMTRLAVGKKAPTTAIIDCHSVRTASQPGVCGDDVGKKITGEKRPILVATQES